MNKRTEDEQMFVNWVETFFKPINIFGKEFMAITMPYSEDKLLYQLASLSHNDLLYDEKLITKTQVKNGVHIYNASRYRHFICNQPIYDTVKLSLKGAVFISYKFILYNSTLFRTYASTSGIINMDIAEHIEKESKIKKQQYISECGQIKREHFIDGNNIIVIERRGEYNYYYINTLLIAKTEVKNNEK